MNYKNHLFKHNIVMKVQKYSAGGQLMVYYVN